MPNYCLRKVIFLDLKLGGKRYGGSSVLKMLGCEMLNSLRTTNIYAFDSDIIKLKIELNSVLENINLVSHETGENGESVELRVNNALAYVKVAEKHIEKVGIAIG